MRRQGKECRYETSVLADATQSAWNQAEHESCKKMKFIDETGRAKKVLRNDRFTDSLQTDRMDAFMQIEGM
jgi:hypothetical protein